MSMLPPAKPPVTPAETAREQTRKFWNEQIDETLDAVQTYIQNATNEGVSAIAVSLSPDTDMCTVDAVLEWLNEGGYNNELRCKVAPNGERSLTIMVSWLFCIGFEDMAFKTE